MAPRAPTADADSRVSKTENPAKPDPQRLARAIEADYRFIWRLLRRFGVPENHTEDAAQQVFLIVAERLSDIIQGRERAFAFGTALRVAQSLRRRLGRELPHDQSELEQRGHTHSAPDELVEQKRARELLDRVLQQMPEDSRTVFILFELEALSSPEIAALIEMPLGTVASRLRRAREQFKALVEAAQRVEPAHEREGR
ncbi:MAG TPA: sigma-70 family RNA polymerase sigma factor [Polyangiales bacterium]|nr:sigma-70 family RNA polymerase sigma factor [Polyangiales bacterium]